MSAVLPLSPGLRRMNKDDLAEVVAIEQAAYDYPWTFGIFRDCLHVGYNCWVYEIQNEIAAYVVMSIGAGEAHILTLVVRDGYRNRGLGTQFIKEMIKIAKHHRVETVLLEVRPSNSIAVNLYRKLGFNELGIRPNYYPAKGGREDAIIMAMQL